MEGDDPFAGEDGGRTVIRPRPGGRSAASGQAGTPIQPRHLPEQRSHTESAARASGSPTTAGLLSGRLPSTGVNPLAAAAAPILTLAARIRGSATVPDVEALRTATTGELQRF